MDSHDVGSRKQLLKPDASHPQFRLDLGWDGRRVVIDHLGRTKPPDHCRNESADVAKSYDPDCLAADLVHTGPDRVPPRAVSDTFQPGHEFVLDRQHESKGMFSDGPGDLWRVVGDEDALFSHRWHVDLIIPGTHELEHL